MGHILDSHNSPFVWMMLYNHSPWEDTSLAAFLNRMAS